MPFLGRRCAYRARRRMDLPQRGSVMLPRRPSSVQASWEPTANCYAWYARIQESVLCRLFLVTWIPRGRFFQRPTRLSSSRSTRKNWHCGVMRRI